MAGIEFAYSQGVWHKLVKTELDKLESEGTFTSHKLTESALFDLQTLSYEEAIMVLKNMYNKPIEKDMSAWIIKECEEMRRKYATDKELAFYKKAKLDFMTKVAVNCSKKRDKSRRGAACKGKSTLHDIALAADILRARRDVASQAKTNAAGGAASQAKTNAAGGAASQAKTKAAGGAASQAKTKAAGGAGSKGPEGFHYVRTPDGQTKKVFEPTTEENPIVFSDSD